MKPILHLLATLLFVPLAALHAGEPIFEPTSQNKAKYRIPSDVLYEETFARFRYGCVPEGWRDEMGLRPSRGWVVDGKGLVRPVLKLRTGLLVYDGYTANVKPARVLTDARLSAEFQKTEDAQVSFGIAGRVLDARNHYLARLKGTDRLELVKVKDGVETALDFQKPAIDVSARATGMVTLRRYREGERWTL